MLTERQGKKIAREFNMRYEPGWDYSAGKPDRTLHIFEINQMDAHSCWIIHLFYTAESVQEVLTQKMRRAETPG